MKIGVSGKGGTGKTTFVSLLARAFSSQGKSVLAVDADPALNLGMSLGFPKEAYQRITPIAELKELISERTETQPGVPAAFFKLNPKVDDIPERYWAEHQGVKLLVVGTIMVGGEGCACPENTLLKNLMRHLIIERDEVVILDMEAGLEHLGRGTVEAMDALIVMVEPGQKSLALAKRIEALARDIGIGKVLFVGNKIQSEDDRKTVLAGLVNEQVLGLIDYDEGLRQADLLGKSVHEFASSKTLNSISQIKENLERRSGIRPSSSR